MTRRIIRRAQATADFFEAAAYLEAAGGRTLSHDFSHALQSALARIAEFPMIGMKADLGPDGLRVWPVRRFSYLVFYIPHADRIDVLRILHAARDVPREFASPETGPDDAPV